MPARSLLVTEARRLAHRLAHRLAAVALVAAAAAGVALAPAMAQDKPRPGWISDPKSGCKLWDDNIEGGQMVSWSGTCVDGLASGPGTAIWTIKGKEEDRYEGEMRGGKMNGAGTLSFPNGMRYEGTFKDNDFHGSGKLTYSNGDVYEGQFDDDDRSGQGTFTMKDGRRYVGQWKKDMPNGSGTLTRADGTSVSGTWKMGCLKDGASKAALVATPRECRIY
jgi:hypothetical protein